MDFFRIVGYTEGFRSYRIGLLAFLALCRKMNSPQILNANPTKSPNLEFGQLVGFRPLHKSGKYWALTLVRVKKIGPVRLSDFGLKAKIGHPHRTYLLWKR